MGQIKRIQAKYLRLDLIGQGGTTQYEDTNIITTLT